MISMGDQHSYEGFELPKTEAKDTELTLAETSPEKNKSSMKNITEENVESLQGQSLNNLKTDGIESTEIGTNDDLDENEPHLSIQISPLNNEPTPLFPNSFRGQDLINSYDIEGCEKLIKTPISKSTKKFNDYVLYGDTNGLVSSMENNSLDTPNNTPQSRSDPYSNTKKIKNKKRSTKYDQAFKEMEELDDFEKECHTADVKKFDFGSYSFEMISNPSKYSYEAWQSNLNIRLGADGRRLLLRKLRSISSTNSKLWQEILQNNNFCDVKNIFTVATVPTLLRIAHLLGREAWDFALKCACFTYKCPSLSMKENEDGSDLDDFYGNDQSQAFSPSKPQVSTRTPQRSIKGEKSTTTESPIRSLGSQERKRKTPLKSQQEDRSAKSKKPSQEPIKESPILKLKESTSKISTPTVDQQLKSETSPITDSLNTSPRKRKPIVLDKTSADSQSSNTSYQTCLKSELEANEERDFLKYLKKIECSNKSYKIKLNSYDFTQPVDAPLYSSNSTILPRNQKFHSLHTRNSPDSINQSDIDGISQLKSNESKFNNTKLTKDLDNFPVYNDCYRDFNPLGNNFITNENITETVITAHDDHTNSVADQFIFVQFLHCITLLDVTRKFISSMKGKYSNTSISNGLNNDIEAFMKDDEDSRLKWLNESTSNQIENLIKMNDILHNSHDSLITSSEIWDPNTKLNRT